MHVQIDYATRYRVILAFQTKYHTRLLARVMLVLNANITLQYSHSCERTRPTHVQRGNLHQQSVRKLRVWSNGRKTDDDDDDDDEIARTLNGILTKISIKLSR